MINKLEYIKEINILKYLKYLNISSDNFRFNCLFHESQSKKSMTINNQNKCYCWSCDKAFDIIDIYQKIKNVDFETALNDLFLISHKKEFEELKTPSIRPQTSKIRAIRTTNKDNHCIGSRPFLTPPILAQKQVFFNKVAKFYHESLLNNSNMLNYLMSKRKITLETIQTFKIGYSDKNNNKLLKLFREENKEHLLLFDLIKYNQKQNFYYDSLTDGFVLPVFHHETSDIKHLYKYNYQAITPFNPKYKALINQNPDSIFYYPYGFFQAQQTILETQTMIIHEGFFDVISCHQNDIKNVVGLITIKSYLSKSMVDFLKTNHITVIIGLDDDESGLINSLRLKQQLDNENIPNIIKQIPSHYPFKDADDLLRNDNSNLYKKIYC